MIDPFEALSQETKYNQLNIEALNLMKEENYKSCLEIYKDLISIAKNLKNNLLELESVINFGVCLFFNGKIPNAIEVFESAIRMEASINKTKISNNIILNTLKGFKIKALSNVILAYISLNRISESKAFFNDLTDYLKPKENHF